MYVVKHTENHGAIKNKNVEAGLSFKVLVN